jgi:superfamily I DNA and/or RNA helicase
MIFINLVVEAVYDEEADKVAIKKELTEIEAAFLDVKKSVFTFMLAVSPDMESDFYKYYGDLLKALEAVKRSRGAEDEYADFHRIADRSYDFYDFINGQKNSLEDKLRLRIDAVKAECLRES